MVQDTPRQLPRPPYWQTTDRFPGAFPTDEARFHDISDIRRPPIDIGRALKEHCNIPVKYYFVAGITEDGQQVTYAGPDRLPPGAIEDFFNFPKYAGWLRAQNSGSTSPLAEEPDSGFAEYHRPSGASSLSGRRSFDRRRTQGSEAYDDEFLYKTRKRPRANVYRREADNDDEPQVQVVVSKRGIKIGNHQEVWDFCDQRFKNMQQTACKLIAKAWVKLVEPKKQSTHPYTGKDEKAPDWWPKAWGPTKEERVRHKEPDHLYKKERVHLLNHILRMIVEPNEKQHPDIQKLNLNTAKLEEATLEALSGFFADKDNPNNAKKKPYLKEIFKVARFEERYKNGEIDADTEIYVMADDKIPDSYQSDNEDSGPAKEDEDPDPSSIQSSVSPQKTVAPHGLMQVGPPEQSPGGNIQGGPFMGELPVRGPHYQPHILPPELGAGQHAYVEGGNMGVSNSAPLQTAGSMSLQEIIPDPHSQSRRPSLFNSPQEYGNPSAPGMYPAWQQATTAPSNSPMYAFTPQQPQQPQQGPFVQQQPMQMGQNQQFMGPSFDTLPRGSYDSNQGDMFRAGNVGSATVSHTQTFPTYIPHDARAGIKMETMGRSHLH